MSTVKLKLVETFVNHGNQLIHELLIARGIIAFAKDPALRARLAATGIAHARRFTWDAAAAQYEALFARLGAAPGRAPLARAWRRSSRRRRRCR